MGRDEVPTIGPNVTGMPASSKQELRLLAGRYELTALLGTGGMGSVFLAKDLELDELVAVKLLGETANEQVREEVKLARSVTHKNVARTYDIGEDEGRRFLTMEYIAGESLARRLGRVESLPVAECIRIGVAICEGLAAAHDAGVVHCDLKPANVMLAEDGRVVIMDFGVAVRGDREPGVVAGTPSYMAPEQLTGGPIDGRCDLYALGAVLFRMSTGRRPFQDAVSDRSPKDPCERSPLPPLFGEAVVRCLALDPSARFPDARALTPVLRAVPADVRPTDDRPPETIRGASLLVERSPRVVAVVLSGDPRGPLARGLRDAMIDRLAESGVLRIAPPPDAEAVVSLTVSVAAARISVELEIATHGLGFWSASYDDSTENVLQLSRAMVSGVATALAVDVSNDPLVDPIPGHLIEAFLEAREDVRTNGPSELSRATVTLTRLSEVLPHHPLVTALLALARTRLSFFGMLPLEEATLGAREAVARAPGLAEARVAYGTALWHSGRDADAAQMFAEGLCLAPGNADLQVGLGRVLLESGAIAAGRELLLSAIERVPSLYLVWFELSRVAVELGAFDLARTYQARIPRDTHGYQLSQSIFLRSALWRGDVKAARLILDEAKFDLTRPPGNFIPLFMEVALEGRAPRAVHRAFSGAHFTTPRGIILGHQLWTELAAAGGDYAFANELLEAAVAAGLHDILWIDRCPLFDELLGTVPFERARATVRARTEAVLKVYRSAIAAVDPVRLRLDSRPRSARPG